ncbi:hypothetical protein E3N88_39924 [Mikania micrantha]|uniref:RING-type E3 ubiquitin transferase n=1 Tax=Mikania micrantha TaxID=192012 RepID=A0A5N6LLD1_9ASTR|nr:hypothetical protein E3N88_39924 [Mikania micrantha]
MDMDNIECVSSSDGIEDEEIRPQITHHFSSKANHNNNMGIPGLTPATSVHELLECPVCTNSMYPPIHQCHNGHTLCSTCKTRVQNRCPTCRQELGDIRCLALEKIAESLELPCRYFSSGCPEIFPYYTKLKHEALCNFRPYNCPYAGSECSVTGDIPFVVTHLRDDHKVDMHTGYTFNHRYVKSNPREVENATWMLTLWRWRVLRSVLLDQELLGVRRLLGREVLGQGCLRFLRLSMRLLNATAAAVFAAVVLLLTNTLKKEVRFCVVLRLKYSVFIGNLSAFEDSNGRETDLVRKGLDNWFLRMLNVLVSYL